jgi:NADPH:quinone reductase-like Zn-dependent oxidoreductase
VSADITQKSYAVVKPGGRVASIAAGGKMPPSPRADVEARRPAVGRDRQHIERIAELVESGVVKVPEIRIFSLKDAAEAHRVSEGRHFRGKLVFKVR